MTRRADPRIFKEVSRTRINTGIGKVQFVGTDAGITVRRRRGVTFSAVWTALITHIRRGSIESVIVVRTTIYASFREKKFTWVNTR